MVVSDEALTIAEARTLFSPENAYLNTATYGLPPRTAWEALQAAGDEWRHGRSSFWQWDVGTGAARESFARLVGVAAGDVAVGPQVSPFAGLVAASLSARARVVCVQDDFTSLLFPFLAQRDRGVRVDLVPLDGVAEAIDGGTALVALSAVQSASGRLADLDAITAAAAHHGAQTFIDATQAVGWLPLDASRFDVVACHAYKWLMAPRGTAFMTVRPERLDALVPAAAGWWAGEDPHTSYFGPPLRLASTARRLDNSPAWFSWVGTQPALELVDAIGVEAIHAHDVGLANRFRAGLGLAPSDSAIVSAEVPRAREKLEAAGIVAAERGGRMRASWHVYNTEADVDAALDALVGA